MVFFASASCLSLELLNMLSRNVKTTSARWKTDWSVALNQAPASL